MKVTTAWLGLWAAAVFAYDPTDSLMDADPMQSGYLPNHNMDPFIISGGSFGQLWKYTGPKSVTGFVEQFYAKPLVYTPSGIGRQVVITFSELNRIYVNDAVNGSLITMRDLGEEGEGPFLVADLGGCNDISNTIGITGTPVIDPTTDTIYFWAKGYMVAGQRGYQNGAYRFHAVDAATLVERPGYPVNLQGTPADNDNTRWFVGGINLQRPSLNLINGAVYAGFGGHCDQYNYTGWIVGMSTYPATGKILAAYVTSGGPGAPTPGPPGDTSFTGGGGACGVWMSGNGLASDNSGRLFFATGNGQKATDNSNLPASGRTHLDTLSESMVNLAIDPITGALTQDDYFEPAQYQAMDAGDRDLGSGGLALLDPGTFSGGGIARLAVTCGKNGQCYVANADNLGGFKMSSSGGDAVVQVLSTPSGNSVFNTIGSYPLEGGYIYITPVGSPTYVYQMGLDSNGRPSFTLVAQTTDSASGAVGIGSATITTLRSQPGTALLWLVDTNSGVRCYNAVPQNGQMIKIAVPPVAGVSKFQRIAFGNGRYYTTANGAVLGFGAPIATPLKCSSPAAFGSVAIGSTATILVNCTTNVALKLQGLTIGNSLYQATNSSLPQSSLLLGQSFSFPVTFNMTNFTPTAGSTSAPSVQPGVQNTAMFLYTTNSAKGFSTLQPIALEGSAMSSNPFLTISPLQVTFPGIVIGTASSLTGTAATFAIHNIGSTTMTILGYAFTSGDAVSGPYTNVTFSGNGSVVLDKSGTFISADLPMLGTTIPAGGSVTVDLSFLSATVGSDFTVLQIYSDGGAAYVIMTGNTNTAPIALLEASSNGGDYTVIPDCAIPANGCTYQIDVGNSTGLETIRFTNTGGSVLTIDKSKPPEGAILGATNPSTDLAEGLNIPPGNSSSATIFFSPPRSQLNSPTIVYSGTWTLNTNDLTWGIHVLNFTGFQVAPVVGPLLNNSQPQFQYLGCYLDSTANRIETTSVNNINNTNGLCQTQALASGFPFAGTEFQTECWTGFVIPNSTFKVADSLCTGFLCPGDNAQTCGGPGGYLNMWYDTTKYNITTGQLVGGAAPPSNPANVSGFSFAGCYSDKTAARTLAGNSMGGSTVTLENCASFCIGFNFFGTEFADECYCANSLSNSPNLEPITDCNMPCAGNKTELCGAGNRLSLYAFNGTSVNTTAPPPVSPLVPLIVGNYSYQECLSDNTTIRSLRGYATASSDMTIQNCAGNCTGWTYFGVEYSKECYCDNQITFGANAVTDGRCKMLCGGNPSEICGGSNGLSLYQLTSTLPQTNGSSSISSSATSATSLSSVSLSSISSSTISSSVTLSSAISSSTISSSITSSNATYSGTTSSSATFSSAISSDTTSSSTISLGAISSSAISSGATSSSTISSGTISSSTISSGTISSETISLVTITSGTISSDAISSSTIISSAIFSSSLIPSSSGSASSGANTPSSSVSSSISFSSKSLGLSRSSSLPSTSSSSLSASTTSSFTSSLLSSSLLTSSSISAASAAPTWASLGCYNDTTAARALNLAAFTNTTSMTVESCQAFCFGKNYPLAGLEFGSQCYCDLTVHNNATGGQTGCTKACAGNTTELCGGSSRINVYSATNYVYPVAIASANGYTQQGCFTDLTSARGLSLFSFTSSTAMTVESCTAGCKAKGFVKAGVEYGSQCYCGNTIATTSLVAPLTDCEVMFCSGNNKEFCGASNRMLVYSSL